MSDLYTMTVDLNVLEHLGINLYSNIAAVLTEAVANAWDADASSVQIRVAEEASNPDRLKSSMTSISPGSRIVHYDTLIRGAQEGYSAYIAQSKSLDKLEDIVNRI